MERKPIDLKSAESEKAVIEALRAELEKRAQAQPRTFTDDAFVAHGKSPAPPRA